MRIFIEEMNYDIWKVVKYGLFVTTHQVNGVAENKDRKILTKNNKENV